MIEGSSTAQAVGAARARALANTAGFSLAVAYSFTGQIGSGLGKRAGICFPSYARDATWTSSHPTDSEFPASNLSDLDEIRKVALWTDGGETELDFILPQARLIDFLALVQHNGSVASRFGVQLSSGTNPSTNIVYSAGLQPIWGIGRPVAGYSALRPILLSDPVLVRSGRITLGVNSLPWEVGAIDMGLFWAWPDVSVDREIGIESSASLFDMAGGADHATGQWGRRFASGQRGLVDQSELDTKLLDFHRATTRRNAFSWMWDVDDASTWPREAWLARNRSLPAGVVNDYEAGIMRFDFAEHVG